MLPNKRRLQSGNPVSRETVIFELVWGGYSSPELVEPLVSDKEPFMFGMPVLAAANAYLTVASGVKYEGPYEDLVPRVVYEMREEWGRGSASSEVNDV
jgi:hypothetical protein